MRPLVETIQLTNRMLQIRLHWSVQGFFIFQAYEGIAKLTLIQLL
jgi:hypothetical protein